MNIFEEIKDIELNTYLSFENGVKDEKENVGTKSEDFEIIQLLGEGGFGKVFKVISKINNKVYAMKVADLDQLFFEQGERGVEFAINETKFLTVLTHPHIIKYYTSFKEDNLLYLIIENAENGDLESYIESNKKIGRHIPEDELWSIFLQCMQGLAYIHKMKVIHRDIKLGNILMDNNMTIKIGDFGTCAVKKNKDSKVENPEYLNANYGNLFDEEEMQCHQTQIVSENFTAKEVMDNPNSSGANIIAEDIAEDYVNGNIDKIEIITTRFNNMMSYSIQNWEILPLNIDCTEEEHKLDALMEFIPNARAILQKIVPMFITNGIFQALLEAFASELASRMTAMSAASNNADKMIAELTVSYNKARQSAITNELIEVVSGASATSR